MRTQTDDRELLDKAAKAAGIERIDGEPVVIGARGWRPWAPLESDSDALRLAVKLKMQVTHYGDCVSAGKWDGSRQDVEEWTGMTGADPYAATRRAIVREAAALADSALPAHCEPSSYGAQHSEKDDVSVLQGRNTR